MSQGTFERRTLNATIRNHGRMRADPECTFIAASVLGGFGSPHPPPSAQWHGNMVLP